MTKGDQGRMAARNAKAAREATTRCHEGSMFGTAGSSGMFVMSFWKEDIIIEESWVRQ